MKILQFPNPILYTKSKEVEFFDADLRDLATAMTKVMHEHKAVGLAAIQIGIPKKIFTMTLHNKDYIFVNPTILRKSGSQVGDEGCLSEEGRYIVKERALNVTLVYQDIHGNKKKKAFSGLAARCILHELDHLDGKRPLE